MPEVPSPGRNDREANYVGSSGSLSLRGHVSTGSLASLREVSLPCTFVALVSDRDDIILDGDCCEHTPPDCLLVFPPLCRKTWKRSWMSTRYLLRPRQLGPMVARQRKTRECQILPPPRIGSRWRRPSYQQPASSPRPSPGPVGNAYAHPPRPSRRNSSRRRRASRRIRTRHPVVWRKRRVKREDGRRMKKRVRGQRKRLLNS